MWARHKEYHDLPASEMTPNAVRRKIADLAVEFIGEDRRQAFLDLLTNSKDAPNYGVAVTNDLKYTGELRVSPLLRTADRLAVGDSAIQPTEQRACVSHGAL